MTLERAESLIKIFGLLKRKVMPATCIQLMHTGGLGHSGLSVFTLKVSLSTLTIPDSTLTRLIPSLRIGFIGVPRFES